jgi:non-homologous end joining protein Ku
MTRKQSFKVISRRLKVIGYAAQGFTIPEIVLKLNEESIVTSPKTVWLDLHSEMAEDYLSPLAKELIRKQMKEIEAHQNPTIKLRYRDKLIGRVLPRREIIKQEIRDLREIEQPNNIRDFTLEEREEIRKAGRILLNKRSSSTGSANL